MATPAKGKWPPNVSAVIITEDERQARLAQAPPGREGIPQSASTVVVQGAQPVTGAPHATIQKKFIQPNIGANPMTQENNSQSSDVFYGSHAILLANKMGVDCVWKTADKQPVDLLTAQTLIDSQGDQSVYFDFDLAAALPDPDENDEDLDAAIMAELPTPDQLQTPIQPPDIIQQIIPPQQKQAPVHVDPVSEREKLAWGGVLSTPGQTVYFRQGVIRIEVEGNVKVQKGQQGNVRMMRITRTDPGGQPVQLAKAIQTHVQPPLAQSPNPAVVYRKTQPVEKVPIPRPQVKIPKTEEEASEKFEEFEF